MSWQELHDVRALIGNCACVDGRNAKTFRWSATLQGGPVAGWAGPVRYATFQMSF
jgi:hypothetical protein